MKIKNLHIGITLLIGFSMFLYFDIFIRLFEFSEYIAQIINNSLGVFLIMILWIIVIGIMTLVLIEGFILTFTKSRKEEFRFR